jgi:hypothetical protein
MRFGAKKVYRMYAIYSSIFAMRNNTNIQQDEHKYGLTLLIVKLVTSWVITLVQFSPNGKNMIFKNREQSPQTWQPKET